MAFIITILVYVIDNNRIFEKKIKRLIFLFHFDFLDLKDYELY